MEVSSRVLEHFDAWLSRTIVTPAPPHKDDKPRHQHCDSASHAVPTVQFGHHTSTFDKQTDRNISMHGSAGPSSHQPPHTRMTNHDTSIVIQQAMPSPQSSSVITQAPSTNRQIGYFLNKAINCACIVFLTLK
ncbi:UNVERIFIED_CONTAM: hypothetical protein FKN15_009517 [Acipenser sinensis]